MCNFKDCFHIILRTTLWGRFSQGMSRFREMKLSVIEGERTVALVSCLQRLEDIQRNKWGSLSDPLGVQLEQPWASGNPSLRTSSSALLQITGSFTSTARARNRPMGVKALIKWIQRWSREAKNRVMGFVIFFCVHCAQTRLRHGGPIPFEMTQFSKIYWKKKNLDHMFSHQ